MSPLLTAAYLHEAKHANYLAHLDSWAEWVMHDMPRTDEGGLQHITYLVDNYQQLWDDTLMMTVLPLAKIGLVLNRPDYVEEAKRQFMLHTKYLADPVTGLWFHGTTSSLDIANPKKLILSSRLDFRWSPSLRKSSLGKGKLLDHGFYPGLYRAPKPSPDRRTPSFPRFHPESTN